MSLSRRVNKIEEQSNQAETPPFLVVTLDENGVHVPNGPTTKENAIQAIRKMRRATLPAKRLVLKSAGVEDWPANLTPYKTRTHSVLEAHLLHKFEISEAEINAV